MNVDQNTAVQKFRCCGAANLKTHSTGRERLTFRHGCSIGRPGRPFLSRIWVNIHCSVNIVCIHSIVAAVTPDLTATEMAILGAESRRVSETAVSALCLQGNSGPISCVIRMHEMNLKLFLAQRAGGIPLRSSGKCGWCSVREMGIKIMLPT